MKNVIAIFDIGKTNKKFFLFDENYKKVYQEYIVIDEIQDEDGFPTEDLNKLQKWLKTSVDKILEANQFDIQALNFSCYGASLVHIDENGKTLTPLYNYMKPLKEEIYESFYAKYGSENELARITGSHKLGMLNTGMHLYWLKYEKPEVFEKIKYSLHLPQYLCYLFTGVPISEYTSIGCHTMLWDFEKEDYHSWVYQEGIHEKLPPIASSRKTIPIKYKGKTIEMGPGIHDSSSALLPYIRSTTKPFILVSTGTWSISINPFNEGMLSLHDIDNGSMFNMRIDGSPVKVSRLFLGNEYKVQVKALSKHFNVSDDYHKTINFDQDTFFEINKDFVYMFKWSSISSEDMPEETIIPYDKFEHAYHQLLLEFVLLQEKSIRSAIGDVTIERLYVDGGFSDNEVYIQLLSQYLRNMKLNTTDSSLGSALGAAMVISEKQLGKIFLKSHYKIRKLKLPLA